MKIIRKSDQVVVGHITSADPENELTLMGLNLDDYMLVKSQREINTENTQYLTNTDWLVLRHRDQVDTRIDTSLTEDEYVELLNNRQDARDCVVVKFVDK